jgi:hypothetical protein
MMPSVIPARLQYQCGHAALVTLPRVKGETATQRNDRVAGEKIAALARQCDFCAPSVAVLEPQVAAVNGNNHTEVAPSDVLESTPVAELTIVVPDESDTSLEVDVEPVVAPAERLLPDVLEPEQVPVEVPEEVVAEAIVESHTEETPAPEVKPVRQPRTRRQPARRRRMPSTPTPPAQPAAATPPRTRRSPARRAPAVRVPAASSQRFVVEYQVERVLRATDIHDLLRQLTAQGAADVLAVIRED